MLAKRVISAVILIPIVGIAAYQGGWVFFGLVAAASLIASYEYGQMLRSAGRASSTWPGLLLVAFLLVDAQWPARQLLPFVLTVASLGLLASQVFRSNAPRSLENWALCVAGGVYIGLAAGHFMRLRALAEGLEWLIVAVVATWVCDTGAYFVGRAVGRRKLAPLISPGKTWEGAWAGLVSGVLATVILAHLLLDLGLVESVPLGILIVAAATIGDLAESVIKRQVGAKDSSHLIPGHGGMLDRIDSLLFVVPVVYYYALALSKALPGA